MSLLVSGCGARTMPARRPVAAADPCNAPGFIWIQTALIEDDIDFELDEDRAYELAAALVHSSPTMSEAQFWALVNALDIPAGVHGYRGAWRADSGIPRQAAMQARCAPEGSLAGPVRINGQGWLVLRHMRASEISSGEQLDAALSRDAAGERMVAGAARVLSPTEQAIAGALEAFGRGVASALEVVGRVACMASQISSGRRCESSRASR